MTPSPSWWNRNWKWVLPVGCLAGIALFVTTAALLIFAVFGFIKSSEVYGKAVEAARASPAVVEAIGTPIEEGYFPSGKINLDDSSGTANLAISLSGPKGRGTLYLEAERSVGEWTFQKLVFEIENDGRRIDLLI